MKRHCAVGTALLLAFGAGALSACGTLPAYPDTGLSSLTEAAAIEAVPFDVRVSDLALRRNPKLWSATLNSTEVLGLFRVGSRYDLVRGPWQASSSEFGGQRLSQQLSAALPVPLTSSNLQLDWSDAQENFWSDDGLTSKRMDTTRLRWAPGRYVLDVRTSEHPPDSGGQRCSIDARLSDQKPVGSLGGSLLSLGSQRCERQDDLGNQTAQLWNLQASWTKGSGLGLPGLTVLRLGGVRATGLEAIANPLGPSSPSSLSSSLELSASSSLQLGRWTLHSELAASPVGTSTWGSRTSVTRRIAGTPITAAWARNQPRLWALAPTTAASEESSIGLDLSSRLRPLLGSALAANLSYKRVDYDANVLPEDDQLHLGLSVGW